MKRIYLYPILFVCLSSVFSCDKNFLDRPPKDKLDADHFYETPEQLKIATNSFYSFFSPVDVYSSDFESDNIAKWLPSPLKTGDRKTPVSKGSGRWSWSDLREINYFLDHYQQCNDLKARLKYSAIARFFRARFYFNKVKRFGEVPWYSHALSPDDTSLYKARDSRKLVMDSIMADLTFSIRYLPSEKKLYEITKYTALFLKARVALFEGTFRKYHNLNMPYKPLLDSAAKAAEVLISSGAYELFTTGGSDKSYRNLFARDDQDMVETILAADYEQGVKDHNIGYRLVSPTYDGWGLTQDLVNVYLMQDGSRFTNRPNYKTMEFYQEMQNRDPRLTQTTAGPDFVVKGETQIEPIDLNGTSTGFRIIKALPSKDQWSNAYFDIIIYRYAEVLLIYAEARAELGIITQRDLDMSINKVRDRVNMPHMNLIWSNDNPDPYLEDKYPNVSGSNKGIILEIRRERRVEMVNEGLRYDDLMRWKVGENLETPEVGIYFPHLGAFDFNNDGRADVFLSRGSTSGVPSTVTMKIDVTQWNLWDPITKTVGGDEGNLMAHPVIDYQFNEDRDYLYPIPTEDLKLNTKLDQNPGWKK